MNKYGLYTKFSVKDGQRDSLVEMLLDAAKGMDSVKGCELYLVNIPENESNSVWVTEIWSDSQAHQASLSLREAQALIERAKQIITGIEQIKLQSLGGKGLYSEN